MDQPCKDDDLYLDGLKEICKEHGYDDPELTESQAKTIMQFVWWRDKAFLVENLAYISRSGECYAPAFKRFLADVIDGKLRKPNHRPSNRAKSFKIIADFSKLTEEGYSLNGKITIENKEYEYGIVDYLADKHKISERHVNNLQRRYREGLLEHYKRHLLESRPGLNSCIIEALAIERFKKYHPGLPLPSKKE